MNVRPASLFVTERTILSLCDYSGAWSAPYRNAGYNVMQVDLKHGDDARLWPSKVSDSPRLPREFASIADIGPVHGILAAPVCTAFAGCGARRLRSDDEIREGLALVDACIRIAWVLKPAWFCLENPVGKLRRWIGPHVMTFQPCDYGDPYTKRTCLWGWFNPPVKSPVEPVEGSKMWANYGGKSERTKEARSATPQGFAKAFYEANP